jgi:hypothetical protein
MCVHRVSKLLHRYSSAQDWACSTACVIQIEKYDIRIHMAVDRMGSPSRTPRNIKMLKKRHFFMLLNVYLIVEYVMERSCDDDDDDDDGNEDNLE